jgi:hypothetical protein
VAPPHPRARTHLTAAVVHGLWLPPVPDDLPVFVSMAQREPRPKRLQLVVMRHTKPIASLRRDGLVVATPDEALLTCARDHSLLDLVVLGDSALHQGLVTRQALLASSSRRRWGSAALNRAVGWMDGRSESPWESLLRVFHRVCGVPVVPQHEVFDDADGRFVARGDLWLVGSRMLHEYDGAGHRDRRTHRDDLDRDRRLLATVPRDRSRPFRCAAGRARKWPIPAQTRRVAPRPSATNERKGSEGPQGESRLPRVASCA